MFESKAKANEAPAQAGAAPEPWGDIYTMPVNFRPSKNNGRPSNWRWLIITLVVLVVAIIGLGLYLVFRPSPSIPSQPPAPVTVTPQPPAPTTPAPSEPLSPAERDRVRYRDVRQIQTALELYYADVNKYPLAPLPIVLGTASTKVLSGGGFTPQAQGTSYLDAVPVNPEPGGTPYLYESLDGLTYSLSFRLEEGIAGLSAADHKATPQGIDGTPQLTTPAQPKPIQPPPATLDGDQDGLTDQEEPLWGTDPAKPDTDSDGFLDGAELAAGYDPTQTSAARLENSAYLAAYLSPQFSYSLSYPKAWVMRQVDPDGSEVMFSGSEGEFVEVLVVANPDNLSASAWYAKQASGLTQAEVPTLTQGNLTWALSIDGLNAYLASADKIIALSYNVGTHSEVSYRATWQAMVKLFSLSAAAGQPTGPSAGETSP